MSVNTLTEHAIAGDIECSSTSFHLNSFSRIIPRILRSPCNLSLTLDFADYRLFIAPNALSTERTVASCWRHGMFDVVYSTWPVDRHCRRRQRELYRYRCRLPYSLECAFSIYCYFNNFSIIMAAVRSRCGHYIFAQWFLLLLLLSFCFFSPNLSRRRLDVCRTSTHGVALVRI